MRAGSRRWEISIESEAAVRDGDGYLVKTWSEFVAVWGERLDKQGREYLDARQEQAEAATIIRIPHIDGITTAMRFVLDGRTYDITSTSEIGRRKGLEIVGVCRER